MIKKMIGFFLLLTLLLSVGTIYANGNPAQNLPNWYKASFQKESEKLGAITATGIFVVLKEVNAFQASSKENSTAAIRSFRSDKLKGSKAGIEAYQNDTKNRLNEAVFELKNDNFDDYVDKLNIEETIGQDFETILAEVLNE